MVSACSESCYILVLVLCNRNQTGTIFISVYICQRLELLPSHFLSFLKSRLMTDEFIERGIFKRHFKFKPSNGEHFQVCQFTDTGRSSEWCKGAPLQEFTKGFCRLLLS